MKRLGQPSLLRTGASNSVRNSLHTVVTLRELHDADISGHLKSSRISKRRKLSVPFRPDPIPFLSKSCTAVVARCKGTNGRSDLHFFNSPNFLPSHVLFPTSSSSVSSPGPSSLQVACHSYRTNLGRGLYVKWCHDDPLMSSSPPRPPSYEFLPVKQAQLPRIWKSVSALMDQTGCYSWRPIRNPDGSTRTLSAPHQQNACTGTIGIIGIIGRVGGGVIGKITLGRASQ